LGLIRCDAALTGMSDPWHVEFGKLRRLQLGSKTLPKGSLLLTIARRWHLMVQGKAFNAIVTR
jgi:hypothetical protein